MQVESFSPPNSCSAKRENFDFTMDSASYDVDSDFPPLHDTEQNICEYGETAMEGVETVEHVHPDNFDIQPLNDETIDVSPNLTTSQEQPSGEFELEGEKELILGENFSFFRRDFNSATGQLSFQADCNVCGRTISGHQRYVWRRSCFRHMENVHRKPVLETGEESLAEDDEHQTTLANTPPDTGENTDSPPSYQIVKAEDNKFTNSHSTPVAYTPPSITYRTDGSIDFNNRDNVLAHFTNTHLEERSKGQVYVADCTECGKTIVGHEKITQVGHFREHVVKRHYMGDIIATPIDRSPKRSLAQRDANALLINKESAPSWSEYFEEAIYDESINQYVALCKICEAKVPGRSRLSSILPFVQHLRASHYFNVTDSGTVACENLKREKKLSDSGNSNMMRQNKNLQTLDTPTVSLVNQSLLNAGGIKAKGASARKSIPSRASPKSVPLSMVSMAPSFSSAGIGDRLKPIKLSKLEDKLSSFDTNENQSSSQYEPDPQQRPFTSFTTESLTNEEMKRNLKLNGLQSKRVKKVKKGTKGDNAKDKVKSFYTLCAAPTSDGNNDNTLSKREEDSMIRRKVLQHYLVGQGTTSLGSTCCVGRCKHCDAEVTTSRKHIHIPKFAAHLRVHHPDVWEKLGIQLKKERKIKGRKNGAGGGKTTKSVSSSTPALCLDRSSEASMAPISSMINGHSLNAASAIDSLKRGDTVASPIPSLTQLRNTLTSLTSLPYANTSTTNSYLSKSAVSSGLLHNALSGSGLSNVSNSTKSAATHPFADSTQDVSAFGVGSSQNRERSLVMLRYPFGHPHDPVEKCYIMVPTLAANEVPTEKLRDLRAILEREGKKLDVIGSCYEIARDGVTVLNKLESIEFRVTAMAVNSTEYVWTLRHESA